MKRLAPICVVTVALLATMAGNVRLPHAEAAINLLRFRQTHSVAKQLPAGFVLPSSDVDLKISSLVAADLDADGDLSGHPELRDELAVFLDDEEATWLFKS